VTEPVDSAGYVKYSSRIGSGRKSSEHGNASTDGRKKRVDEAERAISYYPTTQWHDIPRLLLPESQLLKTLFTTSFRDYGTL